MSVKDFIKKSILESDMYNQAISFSTIFTIIIDLSFALVIGLLIYNIYRIFYKGVIYSKNYAITLVGMTVLTCMVTLAISTNVVISLGMVGALSIVRYRTAIKEPLDLMYMFWAITSGITIGASMYILVVIAFFVVFILILIFSRDTNYKKTYICVIHYSKDETGDEIFRILNRMKYQIRSKISRETETELVLSVVSKDDNMIFTEKIKEVAYVKDISILEYNGEYHG